MGGILIERVVFCVLCVCVFLLPIQKINRIILNHIFENDIFFHIFNILNWLNAENGPFSCVINLEMQYNALIRSSSHRATLIDLINQKEVVGDLFNQLRLALQRRTKGRPAQVSFIGLYHIVFVGSSHTVHSYDVSFCSHFR